MCDLETLRERNRIAALCALNDRLRASLGVMYGDGRVVMTAGIAALPDPVKVKLLQRVREFNTFTPDNDPYGEHDFGEVRVNDVRAFWKIDYYDKNLTYLSEDPADPSKTERMLTIMLAEEY